MEIHVYPLRRERPHVQHLFASEHTLLPHLKDSNGEFFGSNLLCGSNMIIIYRLVHYTIKTETFFFVRNSKTYPSHNFGGLSNFYYECKLAVQLHHAHVPENHEELSPLASLINLISSEETRE